ncbi:transcription factor HHO5-like [Olea europaea subsp. europaea]|uniref:Transcription factor HHO5-like n=1 Tax=Olea europaea subsp. europaea TaxID=158383 RepID=A0A8S0RFQ2_OLEEU|nr:transcription factor HHO5-like [Olea europaea subsp. europaea]
MVWGEMELSKIGGFSKKSKLDFHVQELKEELQKIDAFKRELPLCMNLLKEAIKSSTEEGLQWNGEKVGPVMEEFIPMKSDSEEHDGAKKSNDSSVKKNWMSSFQLWSTPPELENKFDTTNQESDLHSKSSCQEEDGILSNLKKPVKEEREFIPVETLSLSIPEAKVESFDLSSKVNFGHARSQLQQRKQRRCWSPDLHKSFVNALHQLGGAQAATPKQIREFMKVDGLTNDEIKSHLQKYRLHIRKLLTSSTSPLGCSKKSNVNYGSPQCPLHLGGSAKGELATRGDSVEEKEDEKSEFHSWKVRVQSTVEGRV